MTQGLQTTGAAVLRKCRRAAAFACAGLLAGGCHSYELARPEDVSAANRVRVILTAAGTDSLAGAIGAGISNVDGSLVSITAEVVTLRVDVASGPGLGDKKWNGETVAVPRNFVSRIEQPQLSTWRTGLASLGVIALGVAIGGGLAGHGGGIVPMGSTGGR